MKYIITFLLAAFLLVPLAILTDKLVTYLEANEFREWWITIMYVLIAPLTIIVIGLWKNEKYDEGEKNDNPRIKK